MFYSKDLRQKIRLGISRSFLKNNFNEPDCFPRKMLPPLLIKDGSNYYSKRINMEKSVLVIDRSSPKSTSLLRLHNSGEYNPRQYSFGNKTKNYVYSFTIKIVVPASDLPVLKNHIDREHIEKEEVRESKGKDKPRHFTQIRIAESTHCNDNPGSKAGNTAEYKGCPICPGR